MSNPDSNVKSGVLVELEEELELLELVVLLDVDVLVVELLVVEVSELEVLVLLVVDLLEVELLEEVVEVLDSKDEVVVAVLLRLEELLV